MNLKDLQKQVMDSLKKGDQIRTQTLRMLLSEVRYKGIAKYANEWETKLTDSDIAETVKKQIKSHRESIVMFTKAAREDLVDKEKAELTILESFSPAQMSQEQIIKIIKDVTSSGEVNFGKVMAAVMGRCAGNADGALVSRLVREMLG